MDEFLISSCRTLIQWVNNNRILVSDNHINEGAVVWKYAMLVRSSECPHVSIVEFEKRFSSIDDVNFYGDDIKEILAQRYADLVFTDNTIKYVIEVKQEHRPNTLKSNTLSRAVMKDIGKLCLLRNGLHNETIKCYVLYITQDKPQNTFLTNSFEKQTKVEFTEEIDKDTAKSPAEIFSDDFEIWVRCVEGHNSATNKGVGDYCYLLEVVPRKDDEEPENSVNEAQTEIV